MEVEKEVRRMPAKSQPIHQGLSALTVNCEPYKSVVDFTIQVETNKSMLIIVLNFCCFFLNVVICVFTALCLIFNKDVHGSVKG